MWFLWVPFILEFPNTVYFFFCYFANHQTVVLDFVVVVAAPDLGYKSEK